MKSVKSDIAIVVNRMVHANGARRLAFVTGVSEATVLRWASRLPRWIETQPDADQLNALAAGFPEFGVELMSAAHPGFDIKPVEYSVTDLDLDKDGDVDVDDCLTGLIATDGELSDGLEAINDGRAGGRRLDSVTGQRAEFILRRLHDQVAKGIARVKRATLRAQPV